MEQSVRYRFSILFSENTPEFLLLILIAMLVTVSPIFSSVFLSDNNILNMLRQSSYLVIVTIGMMIVIVTGGIDLSVGAVMQLVGLCAILMLKVHVPVWLSLFLALLFGAALGTINGILTVFGKLQPFIATLATMQIMDGLVLTITEGAAQAPKGLDPAFKRIGAGYVGPIPTPVIFMIGTALVFWLLMSKTTYGRYLYVTGSNKIAARNAGVGTRAIEVSAYSLSGLLAALASFLVVARSASFQPATTHSGGGSMAVTAIAAAVIGGGSLLGGKGKILGAILGGLVSAMLLNFLVLLDMNIWVQRFVLALLILVAVVFTSTDLKKRARR